MEHFMAPANPLRIQYTASSLLSAPSDASSLCSYGSLSLSDLSHFSPSPLSLSESDFRAKISSYGSRSLPPLKHTEEKNVLSPEEEKEEGKGKRVERDGKEEKGEEEQVACHKRLHDSVCEQAVETAEDETSAEKEEIEEGVEEEIEEASCEGKKTGKNRWHEKLRDSFKLAEERGLRRLTRESSNLSHESAEELMTLEALDSLVNGSMFVHRSYITLDLKG